MRAPRPAAAHGRRRRGCASPVGGESSAWSSTWLSVATWSTSRPGADWSARVGAGRVRWAASPRPPTNTIPAASPATGRMTLRRNNSPWSDFASEGVQPRNRRCAPRRSRGRGRSRPTARRCRRCAGIGSPGAVPKALTRCRYIAHERVGVVGPDRLMRVADGHPGPRSGRRARRDVGGEGLAVALGELRDRAGGTGVVAPFVAAELRCVVPTGRATSLRDRPRGLRAPRRSAPSRGGAGRRAAVPRLRPPRPRRLPHRRPDRQAPGPAQRPKPGHWRRGGIRPARSHARRSSAVEVVEDLALGVEAHGQPARRFVFRPPGSPVRANAIQARCMASAMPGARAGAGQHVGARPVEGVEDERDLECVGRAQDAAEDGGLQREQVRPHGPVRGLRLEEPDRRGCGTRRRSRGEPQLLRRRVRATGAVAVEQRPGRTEDRASSVRMPSSSSVGRASGSRA